MKIHILDDWFDTLRSLPCFEKLSGHDVTVWTDHEPDPARLAARVQDADCLVLFRERTQVTQALLAPLSHLKLISQRGVYPHIDVAACTAKDVLVCSNTQSDTPSYAAAELTLALILASYRQIPQQVTAIRAGKWQMGVGRTLRGRTLGIYGNGRIGGVVADYAKAMGIKVQFWGTEAGRARAQARGDHVPESREAFFATSDIVTLHVRLTPDSKGIITAEDLSAMAPRSLLVNTSRSGLISTGALEAEIAKGRIQAAVDVYDTEPLTETSHALLTHPNVLPTPHIGFVTEDEFDMQFGDVFDQITAYAAGTPIHMINPQVWS